MSNMIERVAKALREELQKIGYGVGTINARQLSDTLARAAIMAMREPTEEMITAFYVENYGSATEGWHDMIDAALNEKSPATP